MNTKLKPEGLDFAKTHPSPEKRIKYLGKTIKTNDEPTFNDAQTNRFKAALSNI